MTGYRWNGGGTIMMTTADCGTHTHTTCAAMQRHRSGRRGRRLRRGRMLRWRGPCSTPRTACAGSAC